MIDVDPFVVTLAVWLVPLLEEVVVLLLVLPPVPPTVAFVELPVELLFDVLPEEELLLLGLVVEFVLLVVPLPVLLEVVLFVVYVALVVV